MIRFFFSSAHTITAPAAETNKTAKTSLCSSPALNFPISLHNREKAESHLLALKTVLDCVIFINFRMRITHVSLLSASTASARAISDNLLPFLEPQQLGSNSYISVLSFYS